MIVSVDIGSNSIKYLFARSERGALVTLETNSWVTRLGTQLEHGGGEFDENSLQSTQKALREIGDRLKTMSRKIKNVDIVATAAARNANNPERLTELVKKETGHNLKIISGEEEARLSMKGAALAAKQNFPSSKFVFMDIGGASTEVGFIKPTFHAHSFQGGALKCHEGLGLNKIPVTDEVWEEAKIAIMRYFPEENFSKLLKNYKPKNYKAVAVGGTLLSATELCSPIMQTQEGSLVSLKEMERLAESIRVKNIRARKAMMNMDASRADIMPAGILVLASCLKRLGQEEVFVTPWGLRHGLVAAYLETQA